MNAIIEEANVNDIKTMVGCIDKENVASIKIHEKFGFYIAVQSAMQVINSGNGWI